MIKKAVSSTAAILLAFTAFFAGKAPAQATGNVSIYMNCIGVGDYAWNAVYSGGGANKSFNVYTQTVRSTSSGVGGDFDWKYVGKVSTGAGGVGSTNTYYSYHGDIGTVTIKVKINGATASIKKTC